MSQLYRIYFSVIVYNHISCIRLVQSELFKIGGRKRAIQTWIPDTRYWIQASLPEELGSGFQPLVGLRIP